MNFGSTAPEWLLIFIGLLKLFFQLFFLLLAFSFLSLIRQPSVDIEAFNQFWCAFQKVLVDPPSLKALSVVVVKHVFSD